MVVFRAVKILALAALLPVAATPAATAQTASPTTAQAAANTSAPTEPAQQRHVEQVIEDVETAYQTGLSNYQQGHLAAAKSSFDYAVDQMLTCGIDIKSSPELDAEFEHIVDAVNNIEMDALRQGNGLVSAAEATPVGVANDVTFPVDPTIRAEAEAQLKTTHSDLPLVMNDYVASYINFFTKSPRGHDTVVASLERLGRYKPLIEKILRQQGVPQDLIYQAFAESGFRPQIVNPQSGAGGMWQFMPGDAHAPPHSAWFDERFDPVASTIAYANYMKDLYQQFGDWYLAMAAYDWGAGNIQHAVQRTGYADFWELYRRNNLPAETKNYVPIILAITIMAKNPKQYGLTDLTPDAPLADDTVQTDYSVGLPLVADLVGATEQQIASLNPSLLRGMTPPDETFNLHLPMGTKGIFEQRIAEIPIDKRRYWRYHTIAAGDTLAKIARDYHVTAQEIADVNQLTSTTDLSGVDGVMIPAAPRYATRHATLYRVRRGDTLVTIADRFGVTVEQLRRWNHIRGYYVRAGHTVRVAQPVRIRFAPRRGRYRRYHSRRAVSHRSAHRSTKKYSRRTTHHAVRHTTKRRSTTHKKKS